MRRFLDPFFRVPVFTSAMLVTSALGFIALAPPMRSLERGEAAAEATSVLKRSAPACSAARGATALRSPTPEDWYREGRQQAWRGNPAGAARALWRCLELDDSYAPCHRGLGMLYASWGQPERALVHLERYVELAPNAPDAVPIRRIVERLKRWR